MHAADRPQAPPPLWARLHAAGDEAALPAGATLATPARPRRHCFLVLEGTVRLDRTDGSTSYLSCGSFIGGVDGEGRPAPPAEVTVRLESPARLMIYEVARLTALIEPDEKARAAWQTLTADQRSEA